MHADVHLTHCIPPSPKNWNFIKNCKNEWTRCFDKTQTFKNISICGTKNFILKVIIIKDKKIINGKKGDFQTINNIRSMAKDDFVQLIFIVCFRFVVVIHCCARFSFVVLVFRLVVNDHLYSQSLAGLKVDKNLKFRTNICNQIWNLISILKSAQLTSNKEKQSGKRITQ